MDLLQIRDNGMAGAYGSVKPAKMSKFTTNLGDSSTQLVMKSSADLIGEAKIIQEGCLFKKAANATRLELRGRVLVLGTGEVIDLDDSCFERGKKREEIKVRVMCGESQFRMQFASKDVADSWFKKMSQYTDKVALGDFEIITPVGKGGMGSVFLVKHKETNELCAMKVLRRYSVEENEKSMRRALDERMVLEMVAGHPFMVQLKYAFQTEKNLYMVTDFMPGGDLHDYLQSHNFNLSEAVVKHLFSEILLAIEYLHGLGAVYRDLKPENVLLDKNGHIRLADMGLTKILEMGRMGRTRSFCGTKKFMAPEIMKRKGHGQAADMWSLGVLLFSLLTGFTPYSDPSSFVLEELSFPKKVSQDATDLIRNLLQPESSRFTIDQVKNHKWLEGVKWEDLYEQAYEPVPDVFETWELKILGEGRFLHTKMDKLRDLTIGDSVEKGEHFAPRRTGKLHRLVKRGSRVNLIPGYMFTSSVSRGSFSAGSYVSSE
ncbi:hypothetical protein NDN08_007962 [Rhodosorus marinus]|uniref:Protein kinase domain-containing protein n=1 Tax=Rhodosorus marinus TaxID=101924 RepID=A0AAV8V1V1_9RHOD|nr:hypothetical protein NDN08_007962 [Rhodosorus marinus]